MNEKWVIRLRFQKTQWEEMSFELIIPDTRSLFQSIYRSTQMAYIGRKCFIFKTGGLGHVYLFFNMTLKKGVIDVELLEYQLCWTAIESTIRIVVGLTIRLNVEWKSTPGHWVKPLATRRALYRSTKPSTFRLILNNHLQVTTFLFGSCGTNSHVWFCSRTSNSAFIAALHSGYLLACLKVCGIKDSTWAI